MELASALIAAFGLLLLVETMWFVRRFMDNRRRSRFQIVRMVIVREWKDGDDK
jgi:flagellar biogenesis protein FliO